jgi:AcrR family transcriptional regulator
MTKGTLTPPATAGLQAGELPAAKPQVGEGRALRADARRNREAVLAAATRLFASEGLDAQMPDVAREAGVGVGTVYRHFPTKDQLIAALATETFELMADRARQALELPDAWEGISDFIRFAAQIQADDRGLCQVMSSRSDLMDSAARAVGLPELCDQLVKRGQRAGQLRADLEWQDIPMIVCGLGLVTQAPPPPSVGRWPRLVEVMLDGLRAPGSGRLPKPL